MSSGALRRLAEVRAEDAGEVGAKAASLGELIAAGMSVPDGVVLTTGVAEADADDRRALCRAAAGMLGRGPFAVRSSGIQEDGAERSFAGIYESVIGVSEGELPAATDRCLASVRGAQVAGYDPTAGGSIAVLIQRMVAPATAGVALTADPITGDRRTCVVTAVAGAGSRLVSGAALGDEWVVRDGVATSRRRPERAIDRRGALRIARVAERIAAARGVPQDVEWAIDEGGALWILQARPMTALPPDVSWDVREAGAYTRMVRFGEWIGEPVTPLFETWLLPAMEARLHAELERWIGQRAPRPFHVVVNGWYFYSINFLSGGAMLRNLPRFLRQLARAPRRVAGLFPVTVRHSYPLFEREWRDDLLPRYRSAVADAAETVGTRPIEELQSLVDELADTAGEYFASIAALSGAGYKTEMNLARFCRRHLGAALPQGHLPLVAGFESPGDPVAHAVATIDWWRPPAGTVSAANDAGAHASVVESRRAAEARALEALASSPRRRRAFQRLLTEAQHLVPVREEQVRDWTLPWPVMRRAVLRIGEALVDREILAEADDVFFMTRDEVAASVGGSAATVRRDIATRRAAWAEDATLMAPLLVGRVNPVLRRAWAAFPRLLGAVRSDRAIAAGVPASPGRATGRVRVIRGPDEFGDLRVGEVLVAPVTAPAWTPLFALAAAVVTDVGSAAAHASIIAREYGIPAVVGCGDATARLQTGTLVTVDGFTGNVEPK
ncbi:MAG: PEP/pyruvate-binding domain-containing protein [Actinomycetota bacterium]